MTRTLTGIKPTGHTHLGNLLGALLPIARASRAAARDGRPATDTIAFVADLHALTVEHDPQRLRDLTREVALTLLAAGLDPDGALLLVQSQVPEHRGLHYLLEAVAAHGEAHRMVQFKEKGGSGSRLALLTYPVLMAADVLLYDTDEVPVGEDQLQHLELARTLARRVNSRYGPVLTVPRPVQPALGRRVMDLTDPTSKMGKSSASSAGVIHVLDAPDVVRRKVSRAVTDTVGVVRYDPAAQPGVSNLLEVVAAVTGADPAYVASGLTSYAELKACVTETVVEALRPVQARYAELVADPGYVDDVLACSAAQARELAGPVLAGVERALGLVRA